jgi:hypothetical protein
VTTASTAPALVSRCRSCPTSGGSVQATVPGSAPVWRADALTERLSRESGVAHHNHYDPELDAFVVVRHDH